MSRGNVDLQFVEDDALLDEISKRYTHVVFMGRRDLGDNATTHRWHWRGDMEVCLGLCFRVSTRIDDFLRETEDDEVEWDLDEKDEKD